MHQAQKSPRQACPDGRPIAIGIGVTHMGHQIGTHKGIARFFHTRPEIPVELNLVIADESAAENVLQANIRKKQLDCVLVSAGRGISQEYAAVLRKVKKNTPTVLIAPDGPTDLPRVGWDNRAAYRMAAEHLLELGLRHIGFSGFHRSDPAAQAVFRQTVEEGGGTYYPHELGPKLGPNSRWRVADEVESCAEYLGSLPTPAGVFGANCFRTARLLQACRPAGRSCPGDVALLSLGETEAICSFTQPRLSNIDPGDDRVGYEAARLLIDMVGGAPAPKRPVLLPPRRLIERASSDDLYVQDDQLVKVLKLIRQRSTQGLTIEEILEVVPVSRTWLQVNFKKHFGRTPGQEIIRTRLRHARRLLEEDALSIPQVAEQSGFCSRQHLDRAMKSAFGMTASAYRQ